MLVAGRHGERDPPESGNYVPVYWDGTDDEWDDYEFVAACGLTQADMEDASVPEKVEGTIANTRRIAQEVLAKFPPPPSPSELAEGEGGAARVASPSPSAPSEAEVAEGEGGAARLASPLGSPTAPLRREVGREIGRTPSVTSRQRRVTEEQVAALEAEASQAVNNAVEETEDLGEASSTVAAAEGLQYAASENAAIVAGTQDVAREVALLKAQFEALQREHVRAQRARREASSAAARLAEEGDEEEEEEDKEEWTEEQWAAAHEEWRRAEVERVRAQRARREASSAAARLAAVRLAEEEERRARSAVVKAEQEERREREEAKIATGAATTAVGRARSAGEQLQRQRVEIRNVLMEAGIPEGEAIAMAGMDPPKCSIPFMIDERGVPEKPCDDERVCIVGEVNKATGTGDGYCLSPPDQEGEEEKAGDLLVGGTLFYSVPSYPPPPPPKPPSFYRMSLQAAVDYEVYRITSQVNAFLATGAPHRVIFPAKHEEIRLRLFNEYMGAIRERLPEATGALKIVPTGDERSEYQAEYTLSDGKTFVVVFPDKEWLELLYGSRGFGRVVNIGQQLQEAQEGEAVAEEAGCAGGQNSGCAASPG